MRNLIRTDSFNPHFRALVTQLDHYLATQNGEMDSFYAQFNNIDVLKQVVVAYDDGRPVGCGAFKPYDGQTVEIKRMYVEPASRGQRVAGQVLAELERWAVELGFERAILETSRGFKDAVGLYRRHGYAPIDNYGPYAGVENSVCMRKQLV